MAFWNIMELCRTFWNLGKHYGTFVEHCEILYKTVWTFVGPYEQLWNFVKYYKTLDLKYSSK